MFARLVMFIFIVSFVSCAHKHSSHSKEFLNKDRLHINSRADR